MKVKDLNGAVIGGIERINNNALVVTDKKAYDKYINEKERVAKMKRLEEEVSEIKTTMAEILKLIKNSKAG